MANQDRYEGHVIQVKDDSFIARLRDVDDRTARGLEAEIDLRELRPLQQARVLPGAYFTWTISYDMRNQIKASWFDFPKVIVTSEDVDKARADAKKTLDILLKE